MAIEKQIRANQRNAQLSTGPTTAAGKQVVSANRATHGILSMRVLPGEDADEYHALVDGLADQLKPVGMMEQALVERLAISLWRQRRLMQAETAAITIANNPSNLVQYASDALGYALNSLNREDLHPPDQEQVDWCRQMLAESDGDPDLEDLKKTAPLTYKQLMDDADGTDLATYLSEEGGLHQYLIELRIWCMAQLRKEKKYEKVVPVLEPARDMQAVPWGRLNLLAKYQGSIDSEIIKILRALREQQEWRLRSLDPA